MENGTRQRLRGDEFTRPSHETPEFNRRLPQVCQINGRVITGGGFVMEKVLIDFTEKPVPFVQDSKVLLPQFGA